MRHSVGFFRTLLFEVRRSYSSSVRSSKFEVRRSMFVFLFRSMFGVRCSHSSSVRCSTFDVRRSMFVFLFCSMFGVRCSYSSSVRSSAFDVRIHPSSLASCVLLSCVFFTIDAAHAGGQVGGPGPGGPTMTRCHHRGHASRARRQRFPSRLLLRPIARPARRPSCPAGMPVPIPPHRHTPDRAPGSTSAAA